MVLFGRVQGLPVILLFNKMTNQQFAISPLVRIELSCFTDGVRKSGKRYAGGAFARGIDARAGGKLSYQFRFTQDSADPFTQYTTGCSMKSSRLTDGSEPRIAVLAGPDGKGIEITFMMNEPGEEKIVARRMREIFA